MPVELAKRDSILDPKTPLVTARLILAEHRDADGNDMIRYWGGRFYRWNKSASVEFEDEALRRLVYRFCETKTIIVTRGENESVEPFAPNKNKVDQVLDALRAECHLPLRFAAPSWLDAHAQRPPVQDLLICRNGIVNLPAFVSGAADYLISPTPLFWNLNALDYDFLPQAPLPSEWLKFLDSIWPDDPQSISLLQEWYGYALTSDTRLQKMLLMYGPKRSGKGTIARVLMGLLGIHNVAGPTLGSMATNFGTWPLIGKLLAIISDARLSGRTDLATITERLLSISGEDAQTIDRKNMAPLTMRLPTKIMLATNELPKLADASGALASRFLILRLTRSFYGQEDIHLTDRLLTELPGILLWAIEGWRRLRQRGQFTIPNSSLDAVRELDELGSPVSAFVRECCTVAAGLSADVQELYKEWIRWCGEQGRDHPGHAASFGRDLKAAYPGIRVVQPRIGGTRCRRYEGIGVGSEYQGEA